MTYESLSELARSVITKLYPVEVVGGRQLLDAVCTDRQEPITVCGRALEGALHELEELKLIEVMSANCGSNALAKCIPPLARNFRLTDAGNRMKVARLSKITGISTRQLRP
jgi:hypothetical protein